jgi:poly(A) polymerase
MTRARFGWLSKLPKWLGGKKEAPAAGTATEPVAAKPASAKSAAPAAANERGRRRGRNTPSRPTARVIERAEHGISRKHISPNALRVLYRLKDAGFQGYIVGGAVRDLLLGIQPKDFDVATNATPEQVKSLFRNCRLIGRRFRLAHVVYGPEIIEVATFRALSDDGSGERHMVDGRIVRDNVYGSIEDDALRRDFTVNALYYTIEDFSVRDYVGGYDDVRAGVLRLIGDIDERLTEDPVRMLRAVRLAAKLGLKIEPELAKAIPRLAPLIAGSAPARLFDELLKLFMSGHAAESFQGLTATGLLREFLPETAQALAAHGDGAGLIEAALANTDARILADKSVTPAFLLAALLWPAAKARANAMLKRGDDPQLAWTQASTRVLTEQGARIALPRRFTLPLQEIWLLQLRFTQLTRKKAMRTLAHPRFRAAYDFFVLRAQHEPALVPLVAAWEQLQHAAPDQVNEVLDAAQQQVDDDTDGDVADDQPKARRRRRRRRKPKSAGGKSAPGTDAGS